MSCDCESGKMHYCHLKATGQDECLKSISDDPKVTCSHCGAKVNAIEYVCAAHLGADAPNVEGGHGTVDLSEVGKSHAGL